VLAPEAEAYYASTHHHGTGGIDAAETAEETPEPRKGVEGAVGIMVDNIICDERAGGGVRMRGEGGRVKFRYENTKLAR